MPKLKIGMDHPNRPGYYLVGMTPYYRHHVTKKLVFPKSGRFFPIWRKRKDDDASS